MMTESPSAPLHQPVNSGGQSHQNKPRLRESSYMSITLRKGRKEAYRRAQMFLPSHSQSPNWEEKCSQLASLPCFSFNKESGTENFLKQIVTEFLLKGRRLKHLLLKAINQSWDELQEICFMVNVRKRTTWLTNYSVSMIIYKDCLEDKQKTVPKWFFTWFCLCFCWVYN